MVAAPPHGYLAEYSVTGGDDERVQVSLKPAAPQPASLERLRARRTTRSGQQPRPLSSADAKSLVDHFDHRAHFFSPTSREGRYLAKGTIEANRAQAFRDDAQEELAAWIRLPNSQARAHRDGLTQESMEIAGFAGWYVRHFMSRAAVLSQGFGEQGLDRIKQQMAACGGWIVVTSPDGSLPALIEAGRRTERMWLAVRDRSIAVHPMTQMLEESPFRERLAQDLGITGSIQFLLQVGYVYQYPEAVSLRRPVSAILKA